MSSHARTAPALPVPITARYRHALTRGDGYLPGPRLYIILVARSFRRARTFARPTEPCSRRSRWHTETTATIDDHPDLLAQVPRRQQPRPDE